ncbi:cellulose binding domain-containing protein [Streptomyces sp. SAI-229]|uniref:cellulose binding domain-containing protein n=1 Tax=Streptomyces sp. SAI-229 TaxID=3377731 RepID=UPI003C7CB492
MTLASGRSNGSLRNGWNGRNAGTGGAVTVRHTDWNGSVAPGSTVTFGFTVTGGSPTPPAVLTCGRP